MKQQKENKNENQSTGQMIKIKKRRRLSKAKGSSLSVPLLHVDFFQFRVVKNSIKILSL